MVGLNQTNPAGFSCLLFSPNANAKRLLVFAEFESFGILGPMINTAITPNAQITTNHFGNLLECNAAESRILIGNQFLPI